MSKNPARSRRMLAAGTALVLVLAACGGDDDDDAASTASATAESSAAPATSGTDSATATEAPSASGSASATAEESTAEESIASESTASESTAAESTASATPASGDPYVVYILNASPTSDYGEAYDAMEQAVNDRGGINGRPVELVDCRDNYDPNNTTKCTQDAVDAGAIAIIAASTSCGSQMTQIAEAAKLPSIADQYLCADAFASPAVFPFASGVLAPSAGMAAGVETFGITEVIVTTVDVPAGRGYPPLVQSIVEPVGGNVTGEVYVPVSATDLAPYAAQIADQPGILAEGNTVDLGSRLGQQLLQQGFDRPVVYNPTTWDVASIEEFFGSPTNAYIPSAYDLDSEGYQQFDADLKEYAPDFPYRNGSLQNAWLGLNTIAAAGPELGDDITSSDVWDYFNTNTAVDTFGMTPPLDFTQPNESMGGMVPRAVNDMIALYHYEDGKLVRQSEFTDYVN